MDVHILLGGYLVSQIDMSYAPVNYRSLKGAASHFIAKTCIIDM
jgi:hypothetical protein